MIVLDTNIISVMMRPETAPQVLDWLDTQPVESIWTTAVNLFEVRYGLALLTEGKRRRALTANFEQILAQVLPERVLAFDTSAALIAADLMARLQKRGKGIEIRDLQIASIVADRRATLATNNTRHFLHTGIELIDPWGQ